MDPRSGLRAFLGLDAFVRLFVWAASFALTTAAFTYLGLWPAKSFVGAELGFAWTWGIKLAQWMAMFNTAYVLLLLVLRLLVPTPREGRYKMVAGQRMDFQIIRAGLLATLTKARYEAPFPAFLVYHMANLPPLCWLFSYLYGPRTRSCCVTDALFLDPWLTQIGRNVTIGYGAIICAHTQGRDEIVIKRTVIDDDVLIGGNAAIYGGCHIHRGAVILGGAIVRPDTVVGENEVWGGVPARKLKDLPPYGTQGRIVQPLAATI
jgi:hypothetical protein